MDKLDIEEFALNNKLDLREMNPSFYRMLDENNRFVLDIYIKTRNGKIVKNSTLLWKENKWYYPKNIVELQIILNKVKKTKNLVKSELFD